MAASNPSPATAELPTDKPVVTHSGPMPNQGSMGGHGHEMHPQKFLRLVGCHLTAAQQETPHRLH